MDSILDGQSVGVVTSRGRRLLDVPVTEFESQLDAFGCVHLMGFESREDVFRKFVERFASRFVLDLGDSKLLDSYEFRPSSAYVQRISSIEGADQDLHQENGTWADHPELLWFHCIRPAADGGATKVADGVRIWEALSEASKQYFLSNGVVYVQQLPGALWRQALRLLLTTSSDVIRLAGVTFKFLDDPEEQLLLEYRTRAVRTIDSSGRLAFVNSIFGPYHGVVTSDDGSPIPGSVLADMRRAYDANTRLIILRAGESLMIDNRRFLHGRTAFRDTNRIVLSAMAMRKSRG